MNTTSINTNKKTNTARIYAFLSFLIITNYKDNNKVFFLQKINEIQTSNLV